MFISTELIPDFTSDVGVTDVTAVSSSMTESVVVVDTGTVTPGLGDVTETDRAAGDVSGENEIFEDTLTTEDTNSETDKTGATERKAFKSLTKTGTGSIAVTYKLYYFNIGNILSLRNIFKGFIQHKTKCSKYNRLHSDSGHPERDHRPRSYTPVCGVMQRQCL